MTQNAQRHTLNEFLKKQEGGEKHESHKKTESTEKVINLENGEEQSQHVEESKCEEETKKEDKAEEQTLRDEQPGINWFEKLNFSGADELVDITDLKPLYQVRKDTSNKKNVLVSVSSNTC